MSSNPIRAALERLLDTMDGPPCDPFERLKAADSARAALAAAPKVEVGELAADLHRVANALSDKGLIDSAHTCCRAATLLKQLFAAAPAVVPVAVAERPWERPGWLHPKEGWCWYMHGPSMVCRERWQKIRPGVDFRVENDDGWLLPFHAIPLPPQAGEVE